MDLNHCISIIIVTIENADRATYSQHDSSECVRAQQSSHPPQPREISLPTSIVTNKHLTTSLQTSQLDSANTPPPPQSMSQLLCYSGG